MLIYKKIQFYAQKHKFTSYFLIGGFSGFLDLVLLMGFTEVFNIWYIYSSILSFVIISIVGYCLNKYITFSDKISNRKGQYGTFFMVILVGLVINTSVLYILTDWFGLWYVFSRIVSALIALVWNYTASKKFVFT